MDDPERYQNPFRVCFTAVHDSGMGEVTSDNKRKSGNEMCTRDLL